MKLIDVNLDQISGAGLKMSGEDYSSQKNYSYVAYTMQFDGSMPPELQARIDSGESFYSMRDDLMVYSHHLALMQFYHPELFTS